MVRTSVRFLLGVFPVKGHKKEEKVSSQLAEISPLTGMTRTSVPVERFHLYSYSGNRGKVLDFL